MLARSHFMRRLILLAADQLVVVIKLLKGKGAKGLTSLTFL